MMLRSINFKKDMVMLSYHFLAATSDFFSSLLDCFGEDITSFFPFLTQKQKEHLYIFNCVHLFDILCFTFATEIVNALLG